MKKSVMLRWAFFVALGLVQMTAIAGADPGTGTAEAQGAHYGWANGNGAGTGNHYGWDRGNGHDHDMNTAQPVPEPLTLVLLGSGLVGLALIKRAIG